MRYIVGKFVESKLVKFRALVKIVYCHYDHK